MFRVDGPRAGMIEEWGAWVEKARELGCDWLWLAGLMPRVDHGHAFAVTRPGQWALPCHAGTDAEAALHAFMETAHTADLRVATEFAPAFMARHSPHAQAHPEWFVTDPHGTPAIPNAIGDEKNAASLVECAFGGPARDDVLDFWSGVAARIAAFGFDALIGHAAHRLTATTWASIGAGRNDHMQYWAETWGAPIEASEALAPAGFDAFFSSLPWWNFRDDWFLPQERRLRRMAPTIAFGAPPAASGCPRMRAWRHAIAATACWGVVLPAEDAPAGAPRDPACARWAARTSAIHAMKQATPAFDQPSRLRRASAPAAPAVVLVMEPEVTTWPSALLVTNPDAVHVAELDVGALYTRLDVSRAAARECTPGCTPVGLHSGTRLPLEPTSTRWFELPAAPEARAHRFVKAPRRIAGPIAIENVEPRIDAGRHPAKYVLGETVNVLADLVVEGHERPAASLRWRRRGERHWHEHPLVFHENDRWRASFVPDCLGAWEFQLCAWRDRYATWCEQTRKRRDAGQGLEAELGEARAMLAEALDAATGDAGQPLAEIENLLGQHADDSRARAELLLSDSAREHVEACLPRLGLSTSAIFPVLVERTKARTGAWYECFPRSLGSAGQHGRFEDLERHLPRIAGLGFDVVYLPPVHPIGVHHRKGRNNALVAAADDPGSPWAIGSQDGGHTAIHPQLGTLDDFRHLLAAAHGEGLEIALDFAIQCSRDHPWLTQHPEWFRWRPDGSIRYAENPPKKYQDIVNLDFFCADRDALWKALADIVLFWCAEGVRIFRVDNPHTKPLPFWEWLLAEVRTRYPDAVFLAEAFTRPKLMYRLAKIGFSQSYTYFIWRETRDELMEYMHEVTRDPVARFFRPNFWVNTPDINPFYLHAGTRAAFVIRAVLAATLSPAWGMYAGYELCEHEPLRNDDGSEREEYLNAEKYELKARAPDAPGNIQAEIATLNRIRHQHPALSELTNIAFHPADNEQVMFYSKQRPDDLLWIIVSLDAHAPQQAVIDLPWQQCAAEEDAPLPVTDLFADEHWHWHGRRQQVWLSPTRPALILRVGGGASP